MPTYQYACTDAECGNRFELVQSFTDPTASACPVCGGPVRKVFSAVGVVFKGSGFYRNDSREAAKAGASSRSSLDSGKPDSSKSDSAKRDSSKADSSTPSAGSGSGGSGSGGSGSGGSESGGSSKSSGTADSAKPAAANSGSTGSARAAAASA